MKVIAYCIALMMLWKQGRTTSAFSLPNSDIRAVLKHIEEKKAAAMMLLHDHASTAFTVLVVVILHLLLLFLINDNRDCLSASG